MQQRLTVCWKRFWGIDASRAWAHVAHFFIRSESRGMIC